jgi:copper chaperone CopZ
MNTLFVPEMHCKKCVERITKGLSEAGLTFQVSLEDKSVSIEGCENCVKTAISELEDLGFSATKKE